MAGAATAGGLLLAKLAPPADALLPESPGGAARLMLDSPESQAFAVTCVAVDTFHERMLLVHA